MDTKHEDMAFADALCGMTPEQLASFDTASNHPYECRCELCKEWWGQVGPEREGESVEVITWKDVDDEMPDADLTVLVALEDDDDPSWLGFFDGEQWLSASTGGAFAGRVVAWADMPAGPGSAS